MAIRIEHRLTAIISTLLLALLASTSPQAFAEEQSQLSPVGYNIIDGKQDTEHPITNSSLLNNPGFTSTPSSQGTHWMLEKVIGFDSRQQVHNTATAPFRWIGQINFIGAGGQAEFCTGSLISSDTVITAGHCLARGAADSSFTPGANGDIELFPTAKATQVWYDSNFTDPGKDWGIIKLDQPLGNEVGWFGMKIPTDNELQGKFAIVIGYPSDKQTKTMWKDRNKTIGFTATEVKYLADTFRGQSGSPVVDDTATLYALHRGGTNRHNVGTRIHPDLFSIIVNVSNLETIEVGS